MSLHFMNSVLNKKPYIVTLTSFHDYKHNIPNLNVSVFYNTTNGLRTVQSKKLIAVLLGCKRDLHN